MVQCHPIEVARRNDLDIDRPFLPDHFRMDNGSPQHVASFHEVSYGRLSPRGEGEREKKLLPGSPTSPPRPPLQLRIASQCCVERGSEKLSLTSRGYWGAFFRLPLSTSGAAAELERGQGGEVGEVGEVG